MAIVTVSRKAFLKLCGSALVGAGMDARVLAASEVLLSGTADRVTSGAFQLRDATPALFRPHVQSTFRLSSDTAPMRLMLAEVAERPVSKRVEQFSLIFHAPRGAAVADGTHTLHHSTLGTFDLFIVRVGAGKRRTVYQACFSRIADRRQEPGDRMAVPR